LANLGIVPHSKFIAIDFCSLKPIREVFDHSQSPGWIASSHWKWCEILELVRIYLLTQFESYGVPQIPENGAGFAPLNEYSDHILRMKHYLVRGLLCVVQGELQSGKRLIANAARRLYSRSASG
jgi:hypothetical protein